MNIVGEKIEAVAINGIQANFIDEKYGKNERNTFDIWLAKSNEPTPLVIYIHGGGFVEGDKSKYYDSDDLVAFLDAGVSVATINYRFMNEKPYGVLASLNDSKQCLQFIRHHSVKYNIDKTKVACSGGSAGAGTSLWLAFSNDMADPLNEDPVFRESTRLACAGAFDTQSTYDILQWDEILEMPASQPTPEDLLSIARFFGCKSVEDMDEEKETEIRSKLDLLGKMDKNDPPIFVFNKRSGESPKNQDEKNHHPLHAKVLKERAERVGVEAVVYAPEIGIIDESGKDLVDFFLEKLKK
ncbi:MAG: alpha/beta hydrolase [Draconibacterium sp.]|nr:alpha/beta hydrolase [Draconibacterium sp.]